VIRSVVAGSLTERDGQRPGNLDFPPVAFLNVTERNAPSPAGGVPQRSNTGLLLLEDLQIEVSQHENAYLTTGRTDV
jgi:hypothetical protein